MENLHQQRAEHDFGLLEENLSAARLAVHRLTENPELFGTTAAPWLAHAMAGIEKAADALFRCRAEAERLKANKPAAPAPAIGLFDGRG